MKVLKKIVFCKDCACCPTGEKLSNGKIRLKDDFGHEIIIPKEYFISVVKVGAEVFMEKTKDGQFFIIKDLWRKDKPFIKITGEQLEIIRDLGKELLS